MTLLELAKAATAVAAGIIIILSMVPEIWKNALIPSRAAGQNIARTIMQAGGNALWMIHGILSGNWALAAMTCVGCALALILLSQAMRSRHLRA